MNVLVLKQNISLDRIYTLRSRFPATIFKTIASTNVFRLDQQLNMKERLQSALQITTRIIIYYTCKIFGCLEV